MDYKYRFIIYIVLLILTLLVVWVASGLIMAERGSQDVRGGTLPVIQGNTLIAGYRYYPSVYTVGAIMAKVVQCESGWNHYDKNGEVIRGKAGEYGIAQFMKSTWDWFNELRGTNLNILNREHQLELMEWAFSEGLASHWTCYK